MGLYLYGSSALAVLRHLRVIGDERLFEAASRSRSLSGALYLAKDLPELSLAAERLVARAEAPLHVLVGKREQARSGGAVVSHLFSGRLPSGAHLQIENDLYLPTPQLLFLQLARSVDELELLKIGLELCGTYSKGKLAPALGVPRGEDEDVEFELAPVLGAGRLRSFLSRMDGASSIRRACWAADWMLDGAASPMESAVYLLLCLPKRLGGYGLPRPVLNPEVEVQTAHGKEKRYPDLYWKGRSVDVEYQSDYAHSGDWSRYRDSKRQITLVTNKISVLPLTRAQAMSVDDFHAFAIGLHRLLGKRVRGFDASWEFRRAQLRKALLLAKGC